MTPFGRWEGPYRFDPTEVARARRGTESRTRPKGAAMRKRDIRVARVGVALLSIVAALTFGPVASAEPDRLPTMVFIVDQGRPTFRACAWGTACTRRASSSTTSGTAVRSGTTGRSSFARLCDGRPQVIKKQPLTVRFAYQQRRSERREAGLVRRLPGHLAGVRQPDEQRDQPDGLGGHRVGWLSREDDDDRVQEALRRLGVARLRRAVPGARHPRGRT